MPSQNDSKNVKHNIIVRCQDFPEKKETSESWLVLTFLTRELRACARASYRYDVGNGIRSLARSIPVNFF